MYVYCVYPAISKSPKQLPNYAENNRNKGRSNCVLCEVCDYTVTITLHELGTRKGISWSVNVYNKHLFSQCRIKHCAVSTEY